MQRIASLPAAHRILSSVHSPTRFTCFSALALLLLTLFASTSSRAEVCYSAQGRGYGISRYQLDNVGSDWLSAPMDFTSDPWEVAGSEFLDYSRPEVFAAYERRYGPRTACLGGLASLPECDGHTFKRFIGPSNEVRSFLVDALAWWYLAHPGDLGGAGCGDGKPSEREITDVQAVGDSPIWTRYHAEALPGGRAAFPLSVCRTDRAAGAFTEADPFWGWTVFYLNTCSPSTPPPPSAPPPSDPQPSRNCSPPPKAVLDAARRVRNRSSAKAAGQMVIDWLSTARTCTGR